MQLDTVIFGGGAAGLWLLDELVRNGHRAVLLEAGDLGQGQTVSAQGIIHGGLKYTLQGLLTASAACIREMPGLWRDCLSGRREPNLSQVRIRSECCYLWRTESLTSRLGMIGAKFGLHVAPVTLSRSERPTVLANCTGTVARLDEQVIAPDSLIETIANIHQGRILQINSEGGVSFEMSSPGQVDAIHLVDDEHKLSLHPQTIVFTAGAGNANLSRRVGLKEVEMQRRPLHMVMARGPLPLFNGHCVDGSKTRVTITSDLDSDGRTVWQLGGEIAERGVEYDQQALIQIASDEISSVMPDIDLSQVEWSTYRVDRAERKMSGGKRPETVQWSQEGNCITAWPTKLAFVPQLAFELAAHLPCDKSISKLDSGELSNWPRPKVAQPPWESVVEWHRSPSRIHKRSA